MEMNYHKKVIVQFCIAVFFCSVWAGGRLTVITDPQGVEVWVGENFMGNSPLSERLIEPGRYVVKLIDPVQRTSHEEQVLIIEGQAVTIDRKMSRRFGTLNVSTNPSNAQVYLTVPLGTTPLTNEFIIPGQYLIEIRHPDEIFQKLQKSVVVREGTVVAISDTLQSNRPDFRELFLNPKVLSRVALGAGASAGLIWAVVENGNNQQYLHRFENEKAKQARIYRNTGVVVGLLCMAGFQVVAFF